MVFRTIFLRCFVVLLFGVLACLRVQAQRDSGIGHDYRFTLVYDGFDNPDWENSFNMPERYFNYFDADKREFHTIGVPRGQYPAIGKLSTPAGLGIRLENGDLANSFGYAVRALSKTYTSYNVFDSSGVSIIAIGINPANAQQYEYRLVLNDSAVVKDWSAFTQFKKVPENGYRYADLGRLCWPGQYVLIETRHRQSLLNAGSIIVNWPAHPALALSATRIYYKDDNPVGTNGFTDISLLKTKRASSRDTVTGVLQGLQLPGDKQYEKMILDLQGVEPSFPYQALLVRDRQGIIDTVVVDGYFNDVTLVLEPRLFDQPGKYRLLVGNVYFFRTPAYAHWLLRIPFEILPVPVLARQWTFGQLFPYLSAFVVLVGLAAFLLYRRNTRRVRQLEQSQQLRQWQLRSLQHQLNPHFLFNALGAIQNLIGRNDVQSAARYLDRFSSLTRTVLETSGHELISLEDELKMLQTYLEMEQLRTPFSFTIDVDPAIDATNTEIPGMLVQPYVENAVKHGVIGRQDGMIRINVSREMDTLIFKVTDNGRGIQSTGGGNGSTGMGHGIVERRIRLLNELYGVSLIHSDIQSGEQGTTVTVHLKDWFDKTTTHA